ncbi:hypothetical protein [Streptantibioticus ferralitis]|uniref:Uncharacterized protein n=1 Tax=Streptantibioticus ferralitis TaxID=236510 RepID=A0ABT5Z0X1_9ACTN|nr:hypothetical protein [Streptantibioticus ferralitis]MDF2257221.1 hypothetical protein [Streptantibioticus ferralitis]
MSELDEQRIAELAKEPSRLVRRDVGAGGLDEARRVLEWQALTRRRTPGRPAQPGDHG